MIPLAVDLDGTLIKGDLLFESVIYVFKRKPRLLFRCFFLFFKNRAEFKRCLASHYPINAATIPYNEPFVDYLREEKKSGRSLILISASDALLVGKIASHLGIFDRVVASDGSVNMKGERKREYLVGAYGEKNFDYAGNDWPDMDVWKSSRHAVLVNAPAALARRAARLFTVEKTFAHKPPSLKVYLEALRVHHWVKNTLIFLPSMAGHLIFDRTILTLNLLAFLAFGLCASCIYVINDLLDLESDRLHPKKKYRPFASGKLSIGFGLAAAPLLLIASLVVASPLSDSFLAILVVYVVVTSLYSLIIKRMAVLDIICLALLYVLRIFAGSVVTGIPLSKWLLAFALFFFLSLALSKRFSDLYLKRHFNESSLKGRKYLAEDLECIGSLGTASGLVSALVLALYVSSEDITVLYRRPQILWLACPLLLGWISRLWLLTYRGRLRVDPIVFTIRDAASYLVGGLLLLIFFLAL